MNRRAGLAESIRRGDPLPWPVAAILHAATPAQRFGMWLRRQRVPVRVAARVISYGNITAGGTGKTPAVIARAQLELAAGRKVALVTRGYGARNHHKLLAAQGEAVTLRDFGDEARLVALRCGEALAVVRAADRLAGARHAIDIFGCDTILLDDGFQSVYLARDEDVVLIDATNPFGNGHLLPRGILREGKFALARATEIVLTRCDQSDAVDALVCEVAALAPGIPIRRTRHRPERLYNTQGVQPLAWLDGRAVIAVCGIAHPEGFARTLRDCGARVEELRAFPDHAPIPPAALQGELPIVCTEKDYVRLSPPPEQVWTLAVTLEEIG